MHEIIDISTKFTINDNGKIYIGKKVGMRRSCEITVSKNGVVEIGNNCFLNSNCIIASHEHISIGTGTRLGPNVLVYDHDYDYRNTDEKKRSEHKCTPVKIGNNVWIGAGSIILRGTIIGNNSVIGAGSVIKGIYPENSIIIQNRNEIVNTITHRKED